jgi:hypothetical protein
MPEVNYDDSNWEMYKQCEIRMPSTKKLGNGFGYYFDVIWIKADIARKGNKITDEDGYEWTIHEVYGAKKMPGGRKDFKAK